MTSVGKPGGALLAWYRRHRRELPWRDSTDPWGVLVSEVMLQQTQASRVVPVYERFLDRFPDVASAASATTHEILSAWSGLGYNTRALRLRDAARRIVADGWPTTATALRALPGVGPYTAAAVACFAFGEPVAAIDTNMRRVLSRWTGHPLDGIELADRAAEFLVVDDAAAWNQAIMDLGATICRPRQADCALCPVRRWCSGPDTYEAPRSQSRFEGSIRQARGAIVRHLLHRQAVERSVLDEAVGAARFGEALENLLRDGIVVQRDGLLSLAE